MAKPMEKDFGMYYLAFLVVFIGEMSIRYFMGQPLGTASAPAFAHGFFLGLGILFGNAIVCLIRDTFKNDVCFEDVEDLSQTADFNISCDGIEDDGPDFHQRFLDIHMKKGVTPV